MLLTWFLDLRYSHSCVKRSRCTAGAPLTCTPGQSATSSSLLRDEDYIIQATHSFGTGASQLLRLRGGYNSTMCESPKVRATLPRLETGLCLGKRSLLCSPWTWTGEQYSMHRKTRELLGSGSEPFSSASWNETANLTVHFTLVLDEGESDPIVGEIDAVRKAPLGILEINQLPRSHPA